MPSSVVVSTTGRMSRRWAMPSHETYNIKPIRELLDRYIEQWMVVVDPFARNSKIGTITNDLDKTTSAQHHFDAVEFLEKCKERGIEADVVLLDPPYSQHQADDHYNGNFIGGSAHRIRVAADAIIKVGGLAICFGWNTCGLGNKDKYEFVEIMLVAHGGGSYGWGRNDTIVTVQRKVA